MEKYLITGFSGFVSRHFLEFLESRGSHSSVLGIDVHEPKFDLRKFRRIKCGFESLDLMDDKRTQEVIYRFQPNYILHLASYSSVMYSWKNPAWSFQNNTNIFLNLLEVVRLLNLDARILSIGSSEEYGNVSDTELPLREEQPLRPVSPYAVARVSQEMLSRVYVNGYGMDVVITRSFNHLGPGQNELFVVSSFAKQIAEASNKGLPSLEMKTGDLSIVRDFTDVRDVVRAYHLLLTKGSKGEVYNVCSGRGVTLASIVSQLSQKKRIAVSTLTDPKLVRPSDNRAIVGSNDKISGAVGWKPEIALEQSLDDILKDWEARLESE
jgi:GDP-4-dehydro-6-deoxy-D-mannose reductase